MPRVYVAAGSNIDAEANLTHAQAQLAGIFGALQVSPWYRNAAVGFAGEEFINFVFGFETALSVHDTQAQLREVETRCGRPRNAPKWAARAMDLDILLYGDLVLHGPQLILPRPDLLLRPYMLGPLADIAPQLRHPTAGRTIARLWAGLKTKDHEMIAVRPAATVS
ncbi:MAG TPA: 2-amino-4-hydroxy-6-hydroxymethyldihydropteridine diphosphokinase [Steroidobacteraceae bacterium]